MRVFLLVIDGFGVGELPDAAQFGDVGSNTLVNLYNQVGLQLKCLNKLGLYNIDGIQIANTCDDIVGCYGRMNEVSMAKDTTAGHWEIAGVPVKQPFVTFPNGFDDELVSEIEKAFGTKTLCNGIASGTQIINELGSEHVRSGYPICYTSADSVFQIACHEEVVPVEKLYELCEKARKICMGKWKVGRVIARPFSGKQGSFYRTVNRRDFSLAPPQKTLIDKLKDAGYQTIGIGKIEDIFPRESLTDSIHSHTNQEAFDAILNLMDNKFNKGLLFANLIDTDMIYGHRNDVLGYKKCIEDIDANVERVISKMKDDDMLFICADHGNDPTTPSTDHSREYAPLLIYGKRAKHGVNLGTLPTFSVINDTILDLFNVAKNNPSLKDKIYEN